jgi:succinate dehydrogenase / fumarate reductase iron-sulfur subunit
MKVNIYRYIPGTDDVPRMQDYEIELCEDEDMMVLDLLEKLKIGDPTLTFRRSCREGVCGSDGVNINGANALACITRVSDVLNGGKLPSGQRLPKADKIVIRPLPGQPVIRDLVVDMSEFYKQYERMKPYLINDEPAPAQERLQSPEDREKLDGLYECIMCGNCSTACPSWWWNPEKYAGPAALLTAYRFLIDSRDTATSERLSALDDPFTVFRCRGVMNCVSYCPKKLNPRSAIGHIQTMLVEEGI